MFKMRQLQSDDTYLNMFNHIGHRSKGLNCTSSYNGKYRPSFIKVMCVLARKNRANELL